VSTLVSVSDFLPARVGDGRVRGRSGDRGDAIMGALQRGQDEMAKDAAPKKRASEVR
jgi:hypothetical protein